MRRHQGCERDPLLGQRLQQQLGIEVPTVLDDAYGAEIREGKGEIQRIRVAHRHDQRRDIVAGEPHVEGGDERNQRAARVTANGSLSFPVVPDVYMSAHVSSGATGSMGATAEAAAMIVS